MTTFVLMTLGFILIFLGCLGIGRRKEIMDNWEKYRRHPMYMMTAFLYKPEEDPRSRWDFMNENFQDVLKENLYLVFRMILAPIFSIFQLSGSALGESQGGVGKIQNVLQQMFGQFGKITEVFERRFESILFRLAMTFRKLQTAMARSWGIAASTIYQSLATVSSLLSALDLMIKIVIIILVILVAIVVILFLFFWPVIPVILTVIGVITAAGMGAAVGGMASVFCFTWDTQVQLASGPKPIHLVQKGEELEGGGTVLGVLKFQQETDELYELHGVRVSGSHIVYTPDPCFVRDHPEAHKLPPTSIPLYCLVTSNQKIPILATIGVIQFADWEEMGEVGQKEWNQYVFETLNPGIPWDSTKAQWQYEAVLPAETEVQCPLGPRPISELRPGMEVLDAQGQPTQVLGVVDLLEQPGWCWVFQEHWVQQSMGTGSRSIVTEAGTFLLASGFAVRDFTDVGITALPNSYGWVLDLLRKGNPFP